VLYIRIYVKAVFTARVYTTPALSEYIPTSTVGTRPWMANREGAAPLVHMGRARVAPQHYSYKLPAEKLRLPYVGSSIIM